MTYKRTFNALRGMLVLFLLATVSVYGEPSDETLAKKTQELANRGDYDALDYDITPYLKAAGPQELIVRVFDDTDSHRHATGKQVRSSEGFWDTPVSGIWQPTARKLAAANMWTRA